MYAQGEQEDHYQEAIGVSEAFLLFQEQLSRVATVDRPVLIVGERGTGKELAARRIHYLSRRWEEPLVELNCAALAPGLIESELFGHEAGAFTGAAGRRRGRFEGADGGTLFLDELGNVPLEVQEKILRVVEYGVFERVGATDAIRVDVRLVGAANVDLPSLAREGRFMADLLDRLSFEVLYAPPLRDRREDIPVLAEHFANRMAVELGLDEAPVFAPEAVRSLAAYAWPGNVRELKNVVERAVYRAEGGLVDDIVFDPFASPYRPAFLPAQAPVARHDVAPPLGEDSAARDGGVPEPPLDFKEAVAAYETAILRTALRRARFNQREAAASLQLSYHQFRGIYRKYRPALEIEQATEP